MSGFTSGGKKRLTPPGAVTDNVRSISNTGKDATMRRSTALTRLALAFLAAASPAVLLAQIAKKPNESQYKRIHQDALKMIKAGKLNDAIGYLNYHRVRNPEDAETMFMLAVAQAHDGAAEDAAASVQKALDLGLPPGRFIAGPHDLLAPLRELPAYKELADKLKGSVIQGPMLGDVTDKTARVWFRTAGPATVQVLYANLPKIDYPLVSVPVKTNADSDFAGVAVLSHMKPDTVYHYYVHVAEPGKNLIDAKTGYPPLNHGTFRTQAATGATHNFTIAFGGGAGYVPSNERAWNTVHSFKPDALLLLGDNAYIDAPTIPDMQTYCYYRRFSRPEFRGLVADTPVYAIWDDHDFGTNDCWGGPDIDTPAWKRPVWRVFKQNWANPGYGGGEEQPGVWYRFAVNGVDFIMLDCRYYRTSPKAERPSMLGPVQKAWLFDQLKQCQGTFKVLASSVPWVFGAKGDSLDTWNGFPAERNEIFDYLAEHRIEGVVLLSADRHRSDLWKIDRPNAYPLYEFNSSRLTNQHVHGEMKNALFSYNKKQSFGLVEFNLTAADPAVTYTIVTIDGEKVHSHAVKRSELK